MSNREVIRASGLAFDYGAGPILHGVDLAVDEGEFVGLIGPNGSGKSTLVKLMTGYLTPVAGTVSLCGKEIRCIPRRHAARLAGAVPQEVAFHFPYKVRQFVEMGRHPYRGWIDVGTAADRRVVDRAMRVTDTARLAERSVLELSGGEKQRVVLAAALAQDTRILFLDEPTSSLDIRYQIEIYDILRQMNVEHGLTIVAVTHDLNLGAMYCDRLVLLAAGAVVADGSPDRVIDPPLIATHFRMEVERVERAGRRTPYVLPTGNRIV